MKSHSRTIAATLVAAAALIAVTTTFAGALNGAIRHLDRVQRDTTDSYEIAFVGGRLAEVAVSGDGDTDLDLFVYDQWGNLVASDEDLTDDCYVSFYPTRTGTFTVEIQNFGSVYNEYWLMTN